MAEEVLTKSDRRRAALLEGLSTLVAERPFADLSVAEISAQAGVTRSAFYFYFHTKFEALASLLDELEGAFFDVASAWYESDVATDQRVEALRQGMRETVSLWRENAPVLRAMIDAAAVDPASAERWWSFRADFVDRASARIRFDAGPRLRRLGIVPETLSLTLIHGAFAVLEADLRGPASPSADTLATTMAYTWCAAIYGESAWHQPAQQ